MSRPAHAETERRFCGVADSEVVLAIERALEHLGGDELDSYGVEMRKVLLWRAMQFQELGFDAETSVALAQSPADLEQARKLVRTGCPRDAAAQILL